MSTVIKLQGLISNQFHNDESGCLSYRNGALSNATLCVGAGSGVSNCITPAIYNFTQLSSANVASNDLLLLHNDSTWYKGTIDEVRVATGLVDTDEKVAITSTGSTPGYLWNNGSGVLRVDGGLEGTVTGNVLTISVATNPVLDGGTWT